MKHHIQHGSLQEDGLRAIRNILFRQGNKQWKSSVNETNSFMNEC